jgi:hypothetical protein
MIKIPLELKSSSRVHQLKIFKKKIQFNYNDTYIFIFNAFSKPLRTVFFKRTKLVLINLI